MPKKSTASRTKNTRLSSELVGQWDGKYSVIDDQTYLIQRDRILNEEAQQIDICGRGWLFFHGESFDNDFQIYRDGHLISLGQKIIGFMSENSVVDWRLPKGRIKYEIYVSDSARAVGPNEAVCTTYVDDSIRLGQHMESFFRQFHSLPLIFMNRCSTPSAMAQKVQKWLHDNASKKVFISDMAKDLNISASVLSRICKQTFGLSPVKYLNHMRIVSSVRDLIGSHHSVAEISYEMGFGDQRQFNEHFKKVYPVNPSDFKKFREKDE